MSIARTLPLPSRAPGTLPVIAGALCVLALSLTTPAGPFVALAAAGILISVADPFFGILAAVGVSLAVHMDFQIVYRLPLLGFYLYPPDVVALAIVVSLLLYRLAGQPIGRAARLSMPLIAFLVYAHLRCAFALLQGLDPREVMADIRPFTHYGVALLVPPLLASRERMRALLWALLVSSAIGSLYGIFHSLLNPALVVYEINLGFARLTGGSEGAYGPMAAMGMAVLALSSSRPLRLMALVQMPLAGAATLLTYSRGSWISLIAGMLLVFVAVWVRKPARVLPLASGVLAGAVLVVVGLQLKGVPVFQSVAARSEAATASHLDLSLIHRLVEYQTVLRALSASPVFGTGPGTLFHYFMPTVGWITRTYTHNSFLYVLSKWGILGLALYLNFFLLFLWRGARAFPRAVSEERAVLLASMFAGLVALAVKSLSTWHLNISMTSMWVGVMFGTLDALSRPDHELPEDLR